MKAHRLLLTLCICFITILCLSATSHAAFINGDANNDGIHSTADARLALMFASDVKKPTVNEKNAADINRNGYVTTEDATEILRIATGLKAVPKHQYTAWTVTQKPTCTQKGYATSSCKICQKTFTKKLSATGHNIVGLTCTQDGKCESCNKTVTASGHNIIDNICTNCGYSAVNPNITYRGKTVAFKATPATIKKVYGKPQDILTDKTTHGSLTVYVYCSDYGNSGIFTFFNNHLAQFYSNNKKTAVSDNSRRFSLSNADVSNNYYTVGDINITTYTDSLADDGAYTYGYLATVGNSYEFSDTTTYTANEKLVFHLVNSCRAIHSKTPLAYSAPAHKSAFNHSSDMAQNGYFDHTGLNGSSPGDRMLAAGINWYTCAENIAAGYTDAYELNDGWYNSSGHRSNMLNKYMEYLGVGIAYNSTSPYRYFSTENFYA